MSGKRFSGNGSKKNGFYLALAVCLVAVGIAAWSTYEAVQGYLDSENKVAASENSRDASAEDGENIRRKATPAPTPKTQQTDAEEGSKEEAKEVDTPVSEAEAPEAPTSPLYLISEIMINPVSSDEIIKAYSKGTPVFSPTMKDWRIHTGTDFAAEVGEEVKASANGIVKETYTDTMLGNVVAIEHGDFVFYYCGLGEQFVVEPGSIVSAGQSIGTITAVPSEAADEPHLHLEVKRDGANLDPAEILAQFKGTDSN